MSLRFAFHRKAGKLTSAIKLVVEAFFLYEGIAPFLKSAFAPVPRPPLQRSRIRSAGVRRRGSQSTRSHGVRCCGSIKSTHLGKSLIHSPLSGRIYLVKTFPTG